MEKTFEVEKVQQLLDYFYEVSAMCDELNIYERPEMDKYVQSMDKWVKENFGRKIK